MDILLQWNSAPFTAGDAIPLSIQIKGAGLVIRAFLSRFEIPRPRPSSRDSFRNKLETGVQTLGKSILKGASDFHDSTFDTLLDLTALTSAIVAASTKKEYLHACVTLKTDGIVPFVDDFFVILAKAKLLGEPI